MDCAAVSGKGFPETTEPSTVNRQPTTTFQGTKVRGRLPDILHSTSGEVLDLSFVDSLVSRLGRGREAAIPILHAIQAEYRYLPEEALKRVCELTDITPAAITGIASFYSQFRHRPAGRHLISVCHGTACHVKGAGLVYDAIRRHLGLSGEEDTDPGGAFTVQKVFCLGCCTLAPVLRIDGVTYGHQTPDSVPKSLRDFLELERRGAVALRFDSPGQRTEGLAEIRIGMGSCCIAGGSSEVRTALEQAVSDWRVPAAIKTVGCVGMCHQTPLVEVSRAGRSPAIYAKVDPAGAASIVRRALQAQGNSPPRGRGSLLGCRDGPHR